MKDTVMFQTMANPLIQRKQVIIMAIDVGSSGKAVMIKTEIQEKLKKYLKPQQISKPTLCLD